MRFAPEADHSANAGLKNARDFLEPVKGEWRSFPPYTDVFRVQSLTFFNV